MHKIISFLRTSSWLSSQVRTMRNFWAFPWSRLSRSLRFIPIGLWVALLSSSIFPPSSSLALENRQVTTPTATFAPLFPTSTPAPTQDFTCPGIQPVGWGTVTPDAYWNMNCSQCVTPIVSTGTPQPQSTFTISMTGTAQAFVTPTSTPAPTLTLAPTSTPATGTLNMYQANLGVTGSPYIGGQTGSYNASPVLNTPGQLYVITGTVSANDGNSAIGGSVKYDFWFDPLITSGSQTIYVSWSITNVVGGTGASALNPVGTSVLSGSTTYTNQYNSNRQISIGASSSGSRNSGAFGSTFSLWVSTYPFDPFATATPTMTPTPALGYCGTVLADTSGGSEDACAEGVFCAPSPVVGSASCPIDMDSITVPLSFLGFEDVTIPSIRLCFVPIYFGTMLAWGMSIDLDYLGYVMAGAAIVRMILRS